MALKGRETALTSIACFFAWGYAVHWVPALRVAAYVFLTGLVCALFGLLALVVLTSRGPRAGHADSTCPRPRGVVFSAPDVWRKETLALRTSQTYVRKPLYPPSPRISAALDQVLDYMVRDCVSSWYGGISRNPVFANEVDRAVRGALGRLRDRLSELDLAEVLTTRLVPILTAHFRDFADAERSVRGRKLNRSVTETDELDLAIAKKYRDGKVHPAASLAYSDLKMVQQDYLRQVMQSKVLPRILPESLLASRAVAVIIREIVACALTLPIMQMIAEPDTWNQLMESFGRGMLQDRSTVRKLRAALDQHASPAPRTGKPVAFPRLSATDSERRFETFIRAIRKVTNLSDARRFRSEVASQLKKDSQQERVDHTYLRRLEIGKRMLDQKVQHLAGGGHGRPVPPSTKTTVRAPVVSRLENASLVDVLRDPSGLSYFMEYMDRQHLLPLVQFWLVVDGFRNPLEDDGPEGEQLPLQLPPWTESDRLDLAQIDAAYLSKPELKVPESAKRIVHEFLRVKGGQEATPEQYYRARRAILRVQSAVLEEMRVKHFGAFRKSDLFYKALAAEEASNSLTHMSAPPISLAQPCPRSPPPSAAHAPPPNRPAQTLPVESKAMSRMSHRLQQGRAASRKADSASDLQAFAVDGTNGTDTLVDSRRSPDLDPHSLLLFDDDDVGDDTLADSVQSLDQETLPPVPDRQVVQAMEEALNSILEDSKPPTAEDLRRSLFGADDSGSSLFTASIHEAKRGSEESGAFRRPSAVVAPAGRDSVDLARPGVVASSSKEPEKPSLASLGLVSAASRIGVFVDDDLFADEDKFLSDEKSEVEDAESEDEMGQVHQAAPGDLGLAEAITVLTNDIDRLVAQDAVLDSLLRKAELTNNTAELRILRKSRASLEREMRRKELQRQQYVLQESDNSLHGRSTIRIPSVQVGRDDDGKEYALYAVEVSRNAGEKMPAATWVVTRRYSEFLDLHHKLRSRYPSVRDLDFPRRRMVMKLQSEFLRKRRQALETYLSELLLLPDVCGSRDLRAFLSQSVMDPRTPRPNETLMDPAHSKKDMITRIYDSVADGMEDILGSIPVLDQLSLAGQNLIAAATSQLNTMPNTIAAEPAAINAAEAEAELAAFESRELEPFVKPICDIFLEVFELNCGNNWLRGRAVVVVLHQLLGGTIERKLRDTVRFDDEDAVLRLIEMLREALWPGGRNMMEAMAGKMPRTEADRARARTEAGLMLATLVPDLAGSVVGRVNAQAASRRVFATLNNARLNAHLAFTILDEVIGIVFEDM